MDSSIRSSSVLVVFLALVGAAAPHAETLVTLDQPAPYELQAVGFALDREAEVRVEALGLATRDRSFVINFWGRGDEENQLDVYAWIIDAATREPVWVMRRQDTDREANWLREADERLTLGPGRYELYLFSGLRWLDDAMDDRGRLRDDSDDRSWWERLFRGNGRDIREVEQELRDCRVSVSSQELSRSDIERFKVDGELPGALIRHGQVGDSELRVSGFEVDRPTGLRVRALIEGERNGDDAADYGWIVNATTREVVWLASPRRSDRAGGGDKNRLVESEQTFEPGRYLVYYGTDDSHSFDEFNVNPPYDPLNWGIAVFPGAEFDPQAFRTFTPGDPAAPLIDLSRAGDDARMQQGFRLHRGGDLHLVALGEHSDGRFFDQAWIADASGRVVWEMTGRNTRGAGGADKNRMFDGLVALEAGDYVLYYTSDGSHSYDDFNAAKPFEPQAWGVTLRPGPGFEPRDLELVDATALDEGGDVLARLTGVGDDDRQRRRFTLEEATRVSIYALGEGRRGRMYDYGWIVDDDTGERVWEMHYDDTTSAGGADKNRRVDTEIRLPAGTYVVYYETDDSHSFDGWNAAGPRDPFNWGITVRRAR